MLFLKLKQVLSYLRQVIKKFTCSNSQIKHFCKFRQFQYILGSF